MKCVVGARGLGGLFFFQAEDGIRDLVRSRGLGDVYKRQDDQHAGAALLMNQEGEQKQQDEEGAGVEGCLLYTSDAADERSSVDLGGRRIIKKKKMDRIGSHTTRRTHSYNMTRPWKT